MASDPKLDTFAAAAELGVAPKTLRNWRNIGGGPEFVKVGGAVRYRQSALDRYLEERTFSRTPAPARRRSRRMPPVDEAGRDAPT